MRLTKKEDAMTMWLIQGFFFQHQEWLGLGRGDDGVAVVINSGLCRFMYSGVIYPDKEQSTVFAGEMADCFGESLLSEVSISPDEVRFVKKYVHREDLIDYKFKRQENLWVGGYSGSAVGEGGAKCIITEVPETLLHSPR